MASKNKSFVLLDKFVSAIRSAYKCSNKICLLSLLLLFQPLLHLSDALHFLSSNLLVLILLSRHFTCICPRILCLSRKFTNTKSKINCSSSWQPRDSRISVCTFCLIFFSFSDRCVFSCLIRINCNRSQKQFANVDGRLTLRRMTKTRKKSRL